MANGTHAIVLRIRGFNSEDNDWNIPSEITFRDVLVSLFISTSNYSRSSRVLSPTNDRRL